MKTVVARMQKMRRIVIPKEIGFDEGDYFTLEKIDEKTIKITKIA